MVVVFSPCKVAVLRVAANHSKRQLQRPLVHRTHTSNASQRKSPPCWTGASLPSVVSLQARKAPTVLTRTVEKLKLPNSERIAWKSLCRDLQRLVWRCPSVSTGLAMFPLLCRKSSGGNGSGEDLPSSSVPNLREAISGSLAWRRAGTMRCQLLRLASFQNFPTEQVSAVQLAAAGFYATGSGDQVACFSCEVRHGGWKRRDNPESIHRRRSPQCRFLRREDPGIPFEGGAIFPQVGLTEFQPRSAQEARPGDSRSSSSPEPEASVSAEALAIPGSGSSYSSATVQEGGESSAPQPQQTAAPTGTQQSQREAPPARETLRDYDHTRVVQSQQHFDPFPPPPQQQWQPLQEQGQQSQQQHQQQQQEQVSQQLQQQIQQLVERPQQQLQRHQQVQQQLQLQARRQAFELADIEAIPPLSSSVTAGSTTAGSSTAGSAATGSSTAGSAATGLATVGSATIGSATVGSATIGSTTVGSATIGSATVGLARTGSATAHSEPTESINDARSVGRESVPARSTTTGSATVGSATRGSATVGSATRGSATVGSTTTGSATVGSATRGSATEGSATRGSATVGSARTGSASTRSVPAGSRTASSEATGSAAGSATSGSTRGGGGLQSPGGRGPGGNVTEMLNISIGRPRYPQFVLLVKREESLATWPARDIQSITTVSEAGFFYAGQGDGVRCFQCGGGLRNWQSQDQPWLEHARWFPACSFLRQCKGDNFVAAVQQLTDEGLTGQAFETKLREVMNSDTETAAAGPERGRSLEEETAELREEMRCKICLERDVSIVFLPCGHLVACPLCAPALARCPVCRQHVKASVKAYMS